MKTAPLRSRLGNLLIRLSRARQQAVFYDFHLGLLDRAGRPHPALPDQGVGLREGVRPARL